MKKFIPFVLFAACLTFSPPTRSQAEATKLSAPMQAAADKLHNSSWFALGGVGFVGRTSESELAFRELAKDPNAESAFLALINDKTTSEAGRLYALLGLKYQNAPQYEAQLPAFLADESPVSQMSGCLMMKTKVREIAQQIAQRETPQKAVTA